MKNLLCVVLFLFSIACFSQSKIDDFGKSNAKIIQRDHIGVGIVSDATGGVLHLKALHYTDLIANETAKGLKFDYQKDGSSHSTNVDADEVTMLIKYIQILQKDFLPTATKRTYQEIGFKSRAGLQIGAFYSDDKWSILLQVTRKTNAWIFLKDSDLTKLLSLLNRAKAVL